MYKFKKDDIAIVSENQSNQLKRGQIGKIADDSNQGSLMFVPNLPINGYKIIYVTSKRLELLSSIPLDKICVHTKTQEEWDDVSAITGNVCGKFPDTVIWANGNHSSINGPAIKEDNVFDCWPIS